MNCWLERKNICCTFIKKKNILPDRHRQDLLWSVSFLRSPSFPLNWMPTYIEAGPGNKNLKMWSFMANLVQLERGDYVLLCERGVSLWHKSVMMTHPLLATKFFTFTMNMGDSCNSIIFYNKKNAISITAVVKFDKKRLTR